MPTLDESFDLAVRYHKSGHLQQAEALYRQILQIDPAHGDALYLLGVVAHQAGQHQAATTLIRQAIALNPANDDFHFNLGVVLMDQGQRAQAIASYREALRINTQHAEACCYLGIALKDQGEFVEAGECFRQALRLNPRAWPAHYNLGILHKDREPDQAAESFRRALQSNPRHVDAHNNLGAILIHLRRLPEAVEHFEKALQLDPGNDTALWNCALMRMLQGDLEGGWQDYERRWALPYKVPCTYQQPRWDGSSFKDKTILVFAEQGLGDTIQFVRYLPLVKERGGTVLFGCQPALAEICTGFAGVDRLVPGGALLPPFDVQAPLLSLPGIFRTTLATIPAAVPYLRADPGLITAWRREVEHLEGFKVGIAWQGNPKNPGDHFRSLPLAQFQALAGLTGVRLLSLQVGHGTEQLAAAPFPITDLGNRFEPSSLGDLAAVMMSVDLVITVESAVAHLAGALAVPVWVVLPWSSDWRWLLERADSPWYPTMRLFRQSSLGDWEEVFERVATELRKVVEV
jgi:tetratricopeptide (TPR) repeat protein